MLTTHQTFLFCIYLFFFIFTSTSLKAVGDVDMTDLEWRRRYDDMQNKYRDLKEELEVMAARNKRGKLDWFSHYYH